MHTQHIPMIISLVLTLALLAACEPAPKHAPEAPAKTVEAPKEAAPKTGDAPKKAAPSKPDPEVMAKALARGKRNTKDDEHCEGGRKAYDFDGPRFANEADCHILRVHFSALDPKTKEFRDGERIVYCCP